MRKEHILISNDDGITAAGIVALANLFAKEYRVTVVAPRNEQSGKSHSFTYKEGVKYSKESFPVDGVEAYAVEGTPSDCVKVALAYILDEKPDFVVSGINSGYNSGIAVFYSGTIGAAREGAFWRLPAVAFSTTHEVTTLDGMMPFAEYSLKIFNYLKDNNHLQKRMKHFYSVNFPLENINDCKGVVVARQSLAYYNDEYNQVGEDKGHLMMSFDGEMTEVEEDTEFDVHANREKYITITPLSIDSTADDEIEKIKDIENIRFDIKEQK